MHHFLIRAGVLTLVTFLAWPSTVSTQGSAGAQPPQQTRQVDDDHVERIQESIATLKQLTSAPDDGIPQYLLQRAEAIIVIPSLVRGGFIIGAKHGKGIISARNREAGTWSQPAFVNLTGGSVGWQIGAESVDLVLLVMNREGLQQLLQDKFTFGGNLSVAAGPVGRSAEAATNAQLNTQILAYSRAKGLFAGATFEGARLHANDSANTSFYGREMRLQEILSARTSPAELPSAASTVVANWLSSLAAVTGK